MEKYENFLEFKIVILVVALLVVCAAEWLYYKFKK